ncbi:MAG: Bug family tripartite tricarboxylate transporter substrate binding protein [Burkholderiales bacterium]
MTFRLPTPLAAGIAALSFLTLAGNAAAQYPIKPIKWIVPIAAGGPNDIMSRAVASELAIAVGQPVIIENRVGGAYIVGTEAAAKSAPDGYTLLTAPAALLVFQKLTHLKLPYDTQKDFAYIGIVANSVMGLFVHASVPVKTVQELVTYAKANPGKLNYGTSGVGGRFHLATEFFQRRTDTKMEHIPFKGAAQFIPELIAGRIEVLFFPPVAQLTSQVKAGKLRALAMATEERFADMPDVPTMSESGVREFTFPDWIAVVTPAGTPRPIIDRLNRELSKAVYAPGVKKPFADNAFVPLTSTPEQLVQIVDRDIKYWGPVLKALGVQQE